MAEITTEAGKRLLAWAREYHHAGVASQIPRIEAEAVAATLARVRERVKEEPVFAIPTGDYVDQDAILAILDELEP